MKPLIDISNITGTCIYRLKPLIATLKKHIKYNWPLYKQAETFVGENPRSGIIVWGLRSFMVTLSQQRKNLFIV